ncbi:MAG: cytochrome d ubiquinol oxidase subunit II [Muribaculum sp.]|nr:cytochrome d ubiquinol oxidase subunit II [Muribaculaceae bacterium]MCM1081643.1 cytochrome d ubiquinol oxidase subunit II [Muribaculum sp.]
MSELEFLQSYWWIIVSVLGAVLVFLLFVQGGQSMLLNRLGAQERSMMVNALGRKWELTFTTLVVFGGAFFASFPLFYSTSFGGAYWLWMLILFSFVLQAVSYEFRTKPCNIFGTRVYDTFLFINGCVGCFLLGVAVSMFFFGGSFTVGMGNILDSGSPVISQWTSTHGFEAILYWKNWILGLAVFFLARSLAGMYFVNTIGESPETVKFARRQVLINGFIFVVVFLIFLGLLLTASGYREAGGLHSFETVEYIYLKNLISMWWVAVMTIVGVVAVLYALGHCAFSTTSRRDIWIAAIGVVLVVLSLFFIAGFNGTAYYPSLIDASSSLTIRNSSSTLFTLKVMAYVSLLVPFVAAYIIYVWHMMGRKQITPAEITSTDEKY